MSELLTRLRFLFRRRSSAELDDELQFHLEQATQANIAAGMTPVRMALVPADLTSFD